MRKLRVVTLVFSSVAALGALFAACKLDLDEGLIPKGDGGPGGAGGSGGLSDSGFGGGSGGAGTGGGKGDGGPCDADTQCVADSGCLEGKCQGGGCAFQLCPAPSACQARSCDVPNDKCTAPVDIGFNAANIELEQPVGCGGVAARCVAALGDLVFVATSDGTLHAWRTTNPKAPEVLTVDAPTFTIARLIAAESRLLILSTVSSGKLQVAWVDAPSNPQATTLNLASVGVNFSGNVSAVYNGSAGSFFLVDNNATAFFPASYIDPPLQNNATVSQYPSTGLANGAQIVAASGTRLVSFRVDSGPTPVVPIFTLVSSGGTPNAQNGSEQALNFEAPTSLGAHYFASGFDGSVLWATNKVFRDSAGSPRTDTVVLRWPLVPGATQFDGAPSVDIATGYPEEDWNSVRRGPVALIDANTALVTAAYPGDPAQTLVRAVTKSGSTLSLGAAPPVILPFAQSAIGVAANRFYGFVLTPESTNPVLKATLHVFAPSCS